MTWDRSDDNRFAFDNDEDAEEERPRPRPITAGKVTLTMRAYSSYPSPDSAPSAGRPPRPKTVYGHAGALLGRAEQPPIMRKADGPAADAWALADGSDAVRRAARSAGSPLPASLRTRLEPAIGTLDGVRVHTGAESGSAAAALQAKAYTTGQDIHFASAAYDPDSPAGQHLIAHEVAHTVQHKAAGPSVAGGLAVSQPGDAAEVEADLAAQQMLEGRAARLTPSSVAGISRYPDGASSTPRPSPGSEPVPGPNDNPPLWQPEISWSPEAATANIGGEIAETVKVTNLDHTSTTASEQTIRFVHTDPVLAPTTGTVSGTEGTLKADVKQVKNTTFTVGFAAKVPGPQGEPKPVDKTSSPIPLCVPLVSAGTPETMLVYGPYQGPDIDRDPDAVLAAAGDELVISSELANVDDIKKAGITSDAIGGGTTSFNGTTAVVTTKLDDPGKRKVGAKVKVPGMSNALELTKSVETVDTPEAFMKRVVAPKTMTGVRGIGGFDAGLNAGTLEITVKAVILAVPGLKYDGDKTVTGEAQTAQYAGLLSEGLATNRLQPAAIRTFVDQHFTWKAGAAQVAKAAAELKEAIDGWGGQHAFKSGKKGWSKVSVPVKVISEVREVAGAGDKAETDHLTVKLVKLPEGSVSMPGYEDSRRSFNEMPSAAGAPNRTEEEQRRYEAMTPAERKAFDAERAERAANDQTISLGISTGDAPVDWDKQLNKKLSSSFAFQDGLRDVNPTSEAAFAQVLSAMLAPATGPGHQDTEIIVTVNSSANQADLAAERLDEGYAMVFAAAAGIKSIKVVKGAATVTPMAVKSSGAPYPDIGPGTATIEIKGEPPQNIMRHEVGHGAFGLGDTYADGSNRRTGDASDQDAESRKMGAGPSTVEFDKGQMSGGNKIEKQDYASFYKALCELTADMGEYQWKMG